MKNTTYSFLRYPSLGNIATTPCIHSCFNCDNKICKQRTNVLNCRQLSQNDFEHFGMFIQNRRSFLHMMILWQLHKLYFSKNGKHYQIYQLKIITIDWSAEKNKDEKHRQTEHSFIVLHLTFREEDRVRQVTCVSVSGLGRCTHANAECLLRAWYWASDLRVGIWLGQVHSRKRGVFVKGVVLSKWLAGRYLAWAGALTQTRSVC